MHFKNKSGFTLVEVLIAIGLIGAGSVAFMKMYKNQVFSQKKLQQDFEGNLTRNAIVAAFSDPQTCRINLVPGYDPKNPTSSPGVPTYNPKDAGQSLQGPILNRNGSKIYEIGQIIAKGSKGQLKLEDIKIAEYDAAKGTAQLFINFHKLGKSAGGDKLMRKILLFVKLNGAGLIESCDTGGNDSSQIRKDICEGDLKGKWDEDTFSCNKKKSDFESVETKNLTSERICLKSPEGNLTCLGVCGGKIFSKTNASNSYCCDKDVCTKNKIYSAGEWVRLHKLSYSQNTPNSKWANLQTVKITLPFKACGIRVYASFNDSGFIAAFKNTKKRIGLWQRDTFNCSHSVCTWQLTVRNHENKFAPPCGGVEGKSPTFSAPEIVTDQIELLQGVRLKWCGPLWYKHHGRANNDGEAFDIELPKNNIVTIYSTHAMGKGDDAHTYDLDFKICD